jgi:hypothetical protein
LNSDNDIAADTANNVVDSNDTVTPPNETMQVVSEFTKFTDTTPPQSRPHFALGDKLTVPHHWGTTYEVKSVIDDEEYTETYYGFCTLHADAFNMGGVKRGPTGYYKYYKESELLALNPDVKSISDRKEIERRKGKSEMISAAYCAIREAISADDKEVLKTAMHEFSFWWRSLYGTGEINPADVALFVAGEVPIQLELIGGVA